MEQRARVLLAFGEHAREAITSELALWLARFLVTPELDTYRGAVEREVASLVLERVLPLLQRSVLPALLPDLPPGAHAPHDMAAARCGRWTNARCAPPPACLHALANAARHDAMPTACRLPGRHAGATRGGAAALRAQAAARAQRRGPPRGGARGAVPAQDGHVEGGPQPQLAPRLATHRGQQRGVWRAAAAERARGAAAVGAGALVGAQRVRERALGGVGVLHALRLLPAAPHQAPRVGARAAGRAGAALQVHPRPGRCGMPWRAVVGTSAARRARSPGRWRDLP
eukprot:scaffold4850_cov340-Prasinococcus_capsulatus_cf.AAC.8